MREDAMLMLLGSQLSTKLLCWYRLLIV